jgi:hypothetical protein
MWARYILLSAISLCCSISSAEVPLVKVNCEDVKISTMTIKKNNFSFYAYWNEPTTFPNPPQSKKIGKTSDGSFKPFRFSCPDFSVSFNGNVAEIKSVNFQSAIDRIGEFDRVIDLYHYSFYRYPNIREGLITVSYSFDLESFNLKSSIYTSKEGDNLDESIFTSDIPKQAIIGYKVDGGSLKPLLYDRKISHYKEDFTTAEVVDIYHKLPSDQFNIGANIERIFLDKKNGVIRFYIKSKFPN